MEQIICVEFHYTCTSSSVSLIVLTTNDESFQVIHTSVSMVSITHFNKLSNNERQIGCWAIIYFVVQLLSYNSILSIANVGLVHEYDNKAILYNG